MVPAKALLPPLPFAADDIDAFRSMRYHSLSQHAVSLLNLLLRTSLGSDDRICFRLRPLLRTDPG
ncbi:MAG TPA: hypothetical protein ENO05_12565 [Bacteroides sp.]|nr:hypothetical protein [Bacteroides sp.]